LWSTTGAIILFAANIGTPALFIMIKRQAISPLLLPLYTKSFICEVMSEISLILSKFILWRCLPSLSPDCYSQLPKALW